jgi:hypothetical protein
MLQSSDTNLPEPWERDYNKYSNCRGGRGPSVSSYKLNTSSFTHLGHIFYQVARLPVPINTQEDPHAIPHGFYRHSRGCRVLVQRTCQLGVRSQAELVLTDISIDGRFYSAQDGRFEAASVSFALYSRGRTHQDQHTSLRSDNAIFNSTHDGIHIRRLHVNQSRLLQNPFCLVLGVSPIPVQDTA